MLLACSDLYVVISSREGGIKITFLTTVQWVMGGVINYFCFDDISEFIFSFLGLWFLGVVSG